MSNADTAAVSTGPAMAADPSATKADLIDASTRRKALLGSAVGSAVEWYDYFLYGTMAGLVFGPLFFPAADPVSGQMMALASFALAFLIRPIGGIVFSHIGDRIGRKKTLVMTLSIMGLSTFGIGLMPTYDSIGIWAPVLLTLLRLLQGLALGGEWGGGLLMAVEYSPKKRRGLYGAIPQTGALFGLALGNLTASGADAIFTNEQFMSYGWRVPFLLSVLLVGLGLWIRSAVAETPSFKKIRLENKTARVPLIETLKHHWPAVLVTIGAKFLETSTFFIFATFSLTYAIKLGFSRGVALNAVLIAALVAIPVMLVVGAISDRIGRRKMYAAGAICMMAYAIPFFWMMNQQSTTLLILAVIIGFGIIWPMYGAVLGTLFAESYPADVRYTGVSLGYQIGAAIVGGPAPLIATWLLKEYDDSYIPIAIFIMICGVISLISIAFSRDRHGQELDDPRPPTWNQCGTKS
ncbi:MAG: MFS transporter [Azovibrio sp.]|uniref:MFS transporter n=1 Tax=Azovibrio sp. TaxID=1872673 RepID=UPI003C76619D